MNFTNEVMPLDATAPAFRNFRAGPTLVGSLGYGFGNGLRLEVEGAFRRNDVPDLDVSEPRFGGASRAYQQKHGAMANTFLDIGLGLAWIRPYVGAGIGVQWVRDRGDASQTGLAFNDPLADRPDATLAGRTAAGFYETFEAHTDSTRARFAYQAIGGAAFPLLFAPGLSVTAEYRFLGVPGTRRDATGEQLVLGNGPAVYAARTRFSGRVDESLNHSVLLGLRYEFGAGAPDPR